MTDEEDLLDRARKAFAAYRGLGKSIIDEMIAEIERLREIEIQYDNAMSAAEDRRFD